MSVTVEMSPDDAPKARRTYEATAALERKLKEAQGAKELDCPPDFFTEPLESAKPQG
jgi:hypothetical protein